MVSETITQRERALLLVSVLIIAICALTYELIVGTLSSYLLGNSVTQFSFSIGFFLFSMGVGALLSRRVQRNEIYWFIVVELIIGIFGGFSAAILYAVFTWTAIYYYTVMIALILVIGGGIGLEIPLLTRIVASRADLSNALADVLSFDYLGSLIASLAFPLLLLPALGVTQTAFLMGIFNIGVAAVMLSQFRHRLPRLRVKQLWAGIGFFAAIMIGGLIFSTSVFDFFEQRLYENRIIYREQTRFQRIVITRSKEDLRLFLDGNLQFSSRDEYRYHEMLVHPVMSAVRSHEVVLVLGGGDGLVARELLKYPDVEHIIIVDLDAAITDLARDNPLLTDINQDALDDPRVSVINQDAYNYILESSDLYPVIIIDLPDPNNEGLSKLYSQQFYRALHDRLPPDGAIVTQATSPYFARRTFWSIVTTIEASDFYVVPLRTYVPSFGEWGFVIGTPQRPRTLSVSTDLSLHYLTPDVLAAAQVFDPDIARIPADISTLDHPIVVHYYESDWRQWD